MNHMGTAVFLEPRGPLHTALLERKAFLETRLPGQAYTRHPPHCTLLFGSYGTTGIWLDVLQERLAHVAAFTLDTDGWQEFPNDPQALGGHTVAYRARLTPALRDLQQAVAETLGAYQRNTPVSHPFADREPFATSMRRHGFPFVGSHWIPHFTIGSPRLPDGDPLLSLLMSGPTHHSMSVSSVSVWSVDGDYHERLQELALAKPSVGRLDHGPSR